MIVIKTSEFDTSQLCARCFVRFPNAIKNHRFKTCEQCIPNPLDWPETLQLPTKIVTVKNTEMLRLDRDEWVDAAIQQNPNQTREEAQRDAQRYVSKVICYHKNWQHIDAATDEDENEPNWEDLQTLFEYYEREDVAEQQNQHILKTVWHRDICAAKLIMYRGLLIEFEWEMKVQ